MGYTYAMSNKIKVAFVDFTTSFFDRHAIYCLSAYLKSNNVETSYINARSFLRAAAIIKKSQPDLLLYSAFSNEIPVYIAFDRFIKKRLPIKSVIGGVGPTFDKDILLNSSIDAACIGEGESALVDFIHNGFKSTKNIIGCNDSLPSAYYPFLNLEKAPLPDRELVYRKDTLLRDMPSKQFLSGRGCPYACTYCHNSIQNKLFAQCGPIVRKKSVDYLLGEIKEVKERYPLGMVVFQDDTFILKRDWLFEFCQRFPKEIKLPFTCNIRADLINEEVVRALKESNCSCVYWSIESGNDFMRNTLLKRHMSKETILETARLLNKYKIPHRSGGIIGLPGEKYEEMIETLELNIKTRPNFGFASIFIPFPGLELTNYALEKKYLTKERASSLPRNTHLYSILEMDKKDNVRLQKLTFLYPFFVAIPALFYDNRFRKILFLLPGTLLYIMFNLFSIYKQSKLYGVKIPLRTRIAVGLRYLRNPF